MSIEELVNRAYTSWTLDAGTKWSDHMRAALTELAAGYEAVAQVTKMNSDRLLRKANERIRQLEAERVPDGYVQAEHVREYLKRAKVPTKQNLFFLKPAEIDDMLAAAPQQKKDGATGKYGLQVDAERVPEGWVHSCDALCTDGIRLWIDACPHCGMPRAAAQPPKKEGE